MRKRGIGLFIILFSVLMPSLASAQEIIIRGKPYPLAIFIPFVLVIVVWIIILLVWTFRHFTRLSLLLFNVGRVLSNVAARFGLKRLQEKFAAYRKRKMEAASKARGLLVGEKKVEAAVEEGEAMKDLTPFLEKVKVIEQQLPKLNEEVVFKNLTGVIKSFFAALLNIRYEFTEDELVQILEKKRKNLVDFSKELAEMKYGGNELTREDLVSLVSEFKKIVQQHVRAGWARRSVAKGPIEKVIAEDKKILSNIRGYVDFLRTESRKKQIERMLDDERKVLGNNIRAIKVRYNKILELYVQLSPQERAAVYPQLVGFYNNINGALFSTVYSDKSKKQLEYFVEELRRLKNLPRKKPFFTKLADAFKKLKGPEAPMPKIKVTAGDTLGSRMKKAFAVLRGAQVEMPRKIKFKVIKPKSGQPASRPEEPVTPIIKKPLPSMQPLFEKLFNVFKPEEIPTKQVEIPKQPIVVIEAQRPAVQPPSEKVEIENEKKVIEEIGQLITEAPGIERIDYLMKIRGMIGRAKEYLRQRQLESSEKAYEKIRFEYANLTKPEQGLIYKEVMRLFSMISAAKERQSEKIKRKMEAREQRRLLEEETLKQLAMQEQRQGAERSEKLKAEEQELFKKLAMPAKVHPGAKNTKIRLGKREGQKLLEEQKRKAEDKEDAKKRAKLALEMKNLQSEEMNLLAEIERIQKQV